MRTQHIIPSVVTSGVPSRVRPQLFGCYLALRPLQRLRCQPLHWRSVSHACSPPPVSLSAHSAPLRRTLSVAFAQETVELIKPCSSLPRVGQARASAAGRVCDASPRSRRRSAACVSPRSPRPCRVCRRPEDVIVLAQPRIAANSVENHHPERLPQASVPERNCWTAGEALLARLPQARCNADIARDRASAAKARRVSEFCDQTGRSYRPDPIDRR